MKNRILGILVAISVSFGWAVGAAAQEPEKTDIPGIKNFSRIDGSTGLAGSTVGFGGATNPAAMSRLKSEGFGTVISLRRDTEEGAHIEESRAAAEAAGLNYVHLPFNPQDKDEEVVEKFIAAIGDEANQPVYIHCGSATRAAGIWMISRVLEDGWGIDAARSEAEVIALKPADAVGFATEYITSHEE